MDYDHISQLAMDNLEFICYLSDINTNKLLYLNKAARNIFEISDDQSYKDKFCHEVIHSADEQCSFCDNEFFEFNKYSVGEIKLYKNSKHYSLQSTLVEVEGKTARLTVAFDISQLLGERDKLEEQLSTEKTLLACIRSFMHDDEIDAAIKNLLSIVGKYFQADRASLFEIDEKANNATHSYEWILSPELSISEKTPIVCLDDLDYIIREFNDKGEVFIADIETDLNHEDTLYKILNSIQCKTIMLVPIYNNAKLSFFIGIDNPKTNLKNFNLLHSIAIFINEDIKKRRFINQLAYLSYTDTLTGIYNRNKFINRLETIDISSIKSVGVVHVDANSLKRINELYGIEYGDIMLKQIANILTKFIPVDLYRIAGDEFVGFCFDISHKEFEDIITTLRRDYSINPDCPFAVGGIYQDKNINIQLAIQQSGEIMLAEKQNYYKNLSPDSLKYSSYSIEIILNEIRDNMYDIFLQPKVDLISGEIAGAEALVRKFDHDGKMIPPDKFIPIYENEGTIRYLDFFVLDKVCILLRQLINEDRPIKIAVNFSRVTFMAYDLVEEIVRTCIKYSIPHKYVKIEITESIDKMDFDFFAKKLSAISNAGFDVSLDDFGAKHSNLMMLSRGEFSEVKIDKGLIDNIATSAQNRTIIRNIIKIIKELGTSVCVAEGIETKEQMEMLQEQGCTYGQGYYFYKPLPIKEFILAYEKNIHKTKLEIQGVTSENLKNYYFPPDLASLVIKNMPFGLNLWNHKRENILCNNKSVELFDLNSHEEYLTKFFNLSPETQPCGRPTGEVVLENLNEVRYSGYLKFNWLHTNLNEEEIPTEIILQKIDVKNEDGDDFIVGFTRDLRDQLVENENGQSPEVFFYNDLPNSVILNLYAKMSNDIIFIYNYKTKNIRFYGNEVEQYDLVHKKIGIDELNTLEFIYEPDFEIFKDFISAMLAKSDKSVKFRLIGSDKTNKYYKTQSNIIYDSNGNAKNCIGRFIYMEDNEKID